MPTYLHYCENCNSEFELDYSIKNDPPKDHIDCNGTNCVKRLIAGNTGGIMNMTAQEFKEKLPEEIKKIKKRARTDENFHANIVGEKKFHEMVK